jgi:hypothetical protein
MKVSISLRVIVLPLVCVMFPACEKPATGSGRADPPVSSRFEWIAGEPLLQPRMLDGVHWIAVKDPSVVRYAGKWHLFCTVRGIERSHAIIYLTFRDWNEAKDARQQLLRCHPGYFCAPQVFYFTPHKKWYMFCQASDESWEPEYGPAYSTTADISEPDSWERLAPVFDKKPENIRSWLDFWVICDKTKAHLFFTSLNGRMWRCETSLEKFPRGWSQPAVALYADVFEASHTYYLKDQDKYLTLIEAQHGHGWRYYKAYLADRLDGKWTALAAEKDEAFASMLNVKHGRRRWTDVISHGELLRDGYDERLEADFDNLRLLFQGVSDSDRAGKKYGLIPWKLGMLRPAHKR